MALFNQSNSTLESQFKNRPNPRDWNKPASHFDWTKPPRPQEFLSRINWYYLCSSGEHCIIKIIFENLPGFWFFTVNRTSLGSSTQFKWPDNTFKNAGVSWSFPQQRLARKGSDLAQKRIENKAGLALHPAEEEAGGEEPAPAHEAQVDEQDEASRDQPQQEPEGDVDAVKEDEGDRVAGAVRLLSEVEHIKLFSVLRLIYIVNMVYTLRQKI